MSRLNWGTWRRRSNGEPMARVRADHYLTRQDIADILCASSEIETGTRLSTDAIMHYVRQYLSAAPILEPVGDWGHGCTDEEAEEREKWADEQVSKL